MKNRLSRNWIAISIIWVGSLVLTYFNNQTIQEIKAHDAFLESIRVDEVFLKNNFEKISRVLNQRTAMHKPIDSLQIELLSLKNKLKSRAENQNLSGFQMERDPTTLLGDQVGLSLRVNGSYRKLIYWLQGIENEIPYLVVKQVRMLENKDVKGYAFHLEMDFRFNLAPGDVNPT